MASWLWSIKLFVFPVSIIMSSDDESMPILEDQEDSDVSLDPSIHDSLDLDCRRTIAMPISLDDDADMSDDDLLVCELCGAADVDLTEWGDECWVCIACLSCGICGSYALVERNGGYVCGLCNVMVYAFVSRVSGLECALCCAEGAELVERDVGYICLYCEEMHYYGAVSDDEDVPSNNKASDADATSHHADPAREHAAAQQLAGNPINSDPEATQWGVSSHSDSGPTDFGPLVEDD